MSRVSPELDELFLSVYEMIVILGCSTFVNSLFSKC